MNAILLSNSSRVIDGLENMLEEAIGPHGYAGSYVSIETALLIIEIAKRAEDKPEWFLRGKWATIQELQGRVETEISKCFNNNAT